MFDILLILLLIVVLIIPIVGALFGLAFGLFLDFSMVCYGALRLKEFWNKYKTKDGTIYKRLKGCGS